MPDFVLTFWLPFISI